LGYGEGCGGSELEMLRHVYRQQWLVRLGFGGAIAGKKERGQYRIEGGELRLGRSKDEEMRTLVDDNTVFRRGKSEIPESRMEIEESSRERELRREVTDAVSEARDWEVVIFPMCMGS